VGHLDAFFKILCIEKILPSFLSVARGANAAALGMSPEAKLEAYDIFEQFADITVPGSAGETHLQRKKKCLSDSMPLGSLETISSRHLKWFLVGCSIAF
jgi:hypothetical protein